VSSVTNTETVTVAKVEISGGPKANDPDKKNKDHCKLIRSMKASRDAMRKKLQLIHGSFIDQKLAMSANELETILIQTYGK